MSVRNFWLEAVVDGRKSEIGAGPRAKDGGMVVRVKQRKDGKPTDAVTVHCFADIDGSLVARVLMGETWVGDFRTRR